MSHDGLLCFRHVLEIWICLRRNIYLWASMCILQVGSHWYYLVRLNWTLEFTLLEWFVWVGVNARLELHCGPNNHSLVHIKGVFLVHRQVNSTHKCTLVCVISLLKALLNYLIPTILRNVLMCSKVEPSLIAGSHRSMSPLVSLIIVAVRQELLVKFLTWERK